MGDDVRNIIPLSEIREDREEKREEKKYLSETELKNILESYRNKLPSVIIKDLYELLKGRRITKEQLERIIQNAEEKLSARIKLDEVHERLNRIESMLERFSKIISDYPLKEKEVVDLKEERKIEEIVPRYNENEIYLNKIPRNPKSMMFLLKWIEFLIERVGYSGLEDVLDYYVDIGWISEDVLFEVLRYAKGVRIYHEKSDWRPVGYMTAQDHIMSLMFIEALKSGRMNKELLHEVERQIYKIRKEVSEIDGI